MPGKTTGKFKKKREAYFQAAEPALVILPDRTTLMDDRWIDNTYPKDGPIVNHSPDMISFPYSLDLGYTRHPIPYPGVV
jgi:hypothetical protein